MICSEDLSADITAENNTAIMIFTRLINYVQQLFENTYVDV